MSPGVLSAPYPSLAHPYPDSDALSQQPGDRLGNQTIGIRGTGAVRFPLTDSPPRVRPIIRVHGAVGISSTFDVERAEVVRGPQGLLYGAGGVGGTVNTVSKRANFNRRNSTSSWRVDQNGSKQGQFNYNWGADHVAFRFTMLDDSQKYRRVLIGHETQGAYGQFAMKLTPLRTVLRVQGQRTVNERILNTNQEKVAFTNAAIDPR